MGKGTTIMKSRFPLLVLLLGILFLASASVSFGLAYREKENSNSLREGREETRPEEQPWRERGRHQGEEEEEERDPRKQPRRPHQGQEEERRGQEEERDPREQPHRHQQTEQEQEQPRHEEEEERERWEQPRRRHQEQDREGPQGRGEEEEEEEEEPWGQPQTQREREREPPRRRKEQGRRGRGEEEGEKEEREPLRQRPQSQREREQEQQQRGREQEEDEGDRRRERRREDPEERRREERQREEREQRREKRDQREEREEGSQSQSRRQNNPFHFRSNRFQTRYKNRNGQIRVLQRFDQRSNKLKNLQNYRIVEYESRPNTLILPHHADADYILVVLRGRATITVVNPNDRQAYNLERGDALRLPAGTTSYLLNRDDNQNLRVVKLAIPVNKPGQFDDFFPSSTQDQQSYFRGFSRNTLEAAFNTRYEEIQRIILGEDEQEEEQQSQEEGVIVRVSKEQIQELSRHAQSISRRGKPSESGPFNLRSNKPIYSNRFGNFYEITLDKNPQLQDLELSLSSVDINEGALFLPHYNSKAIVVVVVNEGRGNLELVGLKEQHHQLQEQEEEEEEQHEEQEEEGNRQVQRYRSRLSEGDIFVIPAGHPVSINASSNLHLLGFGINAENNQRNFLAGEDDNVLSQLDRQVKELAFPGSAQDVERLINNQRQSYFANARPQQREEGRRGRRDFLSSILRPFY